MAKPYYQSEAERIAREYLSGGNDPEEQYSTTQQAAYEAACTVYSQTTLDYGFDLNAYRASFFSLMNMVPVALSLDNPTFSLFLHASMDVCARKILAASNHPVQLKGQQSIFPTNGQRKP